MSNISIQPDTACLAGCERQKAFTYYLILPAVSKKDAKPTDGLKFFRVPAPQTAGFIFRDRL